MRNIVWSAASSVTSVLPAGGAGRFGPQEQRKRRHAQAVAATLGQLKQTANMRVYIDDTPTMAAATFAGMSGLRTWSPPV